MAVLLGVNIDHVATVRQARGTPYPSVIEAARLAERAGADVEKLCAITATRINLEMAVTSEMLEIALRHRPADVCLVPERREELTTEGGLDVAANRSAVAAAVQRLQAAGIRTSLFIDPEPEQLRAAAEAGAPVVELHTGTYADADQERQATELERLRQACLLGHGLGLQINAGHGLNLDNVGPVTRLPHMNELNIGHAIVARAIFVGLQAAVEEMKQAMVSA
jgi:pyridoxine 5-phosphate synthase